MNKRFVTGMLVYALVFLVIASVGLWVMWDYIEAYEYSRPVNAIKAYVDSLTPEDLSMGSADLLDTLDTHLQSREESSRLIQESAEQTFSYAKKSAESTENRQVYVLRSGRQVIGEFAITSAEPDKFGFRVWEVTEESFDFSHLLGESVSVTVPSDFTVLVNGAALDESYITAQGIPYACLEEFYGNYPLPSLVTYSADAYLGQATLEVLDREGDPIEITADTDYNLLMQECTEEEVAAIDTLAAQFLEYYVAFTGSSSGTAGGNYNRLCRYLVPEGELSKRLYTAISGLYFAQSLRDTIQETRVNQYASLGNGRYYCDITYVVETVGRKGPVQQSYNMKVIMLETDMGLRVEGMSRY